MKKLVLSLAFVGLGTFAMAQQTEARKFDKAQMHQKHEAKLQEMKKELGLSDAQVAQIKELNSKKMEARKAERQEKVAQMSAKKQQHESEMKSILTADQYKKWEQNRAEKMQERKAKFSEKKAHSKK